MNFIFFISSIIIFFYISWLMLNTFKNKFLFKDDGNWFYYAIFQDQGLKHFKIHDGEFYDTGCGFYGLQLISAFLYKKNGKNKLTFFNKIKIILYALQSSIIYCIIYLYNFDLITSFILAIIFNLIYFIPTRYYYWTYAEHIQMLPVLLAFVFVKSAFLFHFLPLVICAGIVISLSLHWKITGLILVILFPLIFFFDNFSTNILYYLIGLAIANIFIPFIVYDWKRFCIYILLFIRNILYYFFITIDKFYNTSSFNKKIFNKLNKKIFFFSGLPLSETINDKKGKSNDDIKGYTTSRRKQQYPKDHVINIVKNFIKDFQLLFVMAIAQIIYGVYIMDFLTISITIFFIGAIIIWKIQGGHTHAHLNIVIPPLFILFAVGMSNLFFSSFFGKILAIVYALFIINDYFPFFYSEIKHKTRNLPCYSNAHNMYTMVAEEIGEYIKDKTLVSERIYVWGNMPVIYLYSERQCLDFRFLFTYPIGIKIIHYNIKLLLDKLRKNPPKYFVLFQYIDFVDEWDIAKIQNEISVPYKLDKLFEVKANDIKYNPIPVYKRNDKLFCEILIEKYRLTKNKKYLDQIFQVDSENKEAKFWLNIANSSFNFEESIEFLSKYDFDTLSNKLAEIYLLKEYDKSEELDKKVLNLEGFYQDWRVFLEIGECYFNNGKLQTALDMYSKALKFNSLSAELFNNFGVLSFQLNDTKQAISLFEKALFILPEYKDAKENLIDTKK